MARYIAVKLDNDDISDEEAKAILSDVVAGDDELSDVIIIEVGFTPMASCSRTWETAYLIRTK